METLLSIIYKSGNSHLDRGPRTLELGNGAPGRMFDASLERLSVTETSYNNSLAERVPRSTVQALYTPLYTTGLLGTDMHQKGCQLLCGHL